MKLWHPLKLTSLCYIGVDLSLSLGGVVYDDVWVTISGISGMLGNLALLLGGSGQKEIASHLLRRFAPYAERASMSLYALQNIALVLSGFLTFSYILYASIIAGIIGFTGCMVALFWPRSGRLQPYQLAGYIWFFSSCLYIVSGVQSGNIGLVVAGLLCIMGSVFVAISRRAEFQSAISH